jgi:hypothetical protein
VLEFGHSLVIEDVAREILPWLDRYLGPVVPAVSKQAFAPTADGSTTR